MPRTQALDDMDLAAHHRRAVERPVAHLEADADTQALVLAGSLAHGYARPDWDVDVPMVITPERAEEPTEDTELAWLHGRLPIDDR